MTFAKKFLPLIFLSAILFLPSTSVAEKKILRLVQLPIIFQSTQPDLKTCSALETKISRAVHIPLNNTLQLVEYVDRKESVTAINEIWQKNSTSKLSDAMRPLAEKINADIIVCPVLRNYRQTTFHSGFHFETYLVSNVSATLIVYDRRNDELVEKKTSRSFQSSYSKFGTADYLAKDCFDRLIAATKLQQKIFNIK